MAPVSVIFRLMNESGEQVQGFKLQQPKSRLRAPLQELVEKFVRHHNRRLEEGAEALDASVLVATEAGRRLDTREPIGSFLAPNSTWLEIELRVGSGEEEAPATEEVKDEPVQEEVPPLDLTDYPPPNELIYSKDEFDRLLRGVGPEVGLALLFETPSDPACDRLAPKYKRMAHHFWPQILMIRVDIAQADLAKACSAVVAPTIMFFKNRKATDKLVGTDEMQLNVKLAKLVKL